VKRVLWILGGLALLALLAFVFFGGNNGGEGPRQEIKRVRAERQDLRVVVSAPGEAKPLRRVELKCKASGLVTGFPKRVGASVESGEVVATLDPKTEERNVKREQANYDSAVAKLNLLRHEHERAVRQSESELAAAEEDARTKTAALESLEKTDISQTELATARLNARLAQEKKIQVEASLALIRKRKDEDQALATAEVKKAEVALQDAQERKTDTEIKAPFHGILLEKMVEEGQIVSSGISAASGGTTIAVIADVSTLFIEANVDETDIGKVRNAKSAVITLQGLPTRRFRGVVDLVPPQGTLESSIKVFRVLIRIADTDFERPYIGMTATVEIEVDEAKNVVVVPSEAVRGEKGQKYVLVPEGDGQKQVPVEIGLDNGMRTEIKSGLSENQEVLVVYTISPDAGRGGARPPLRRF